MSKYKVGDKVRVLYNGNYSAKRAMVGQICEIKDIDLTCSSGGYAIWQPDKKDYWYFDENEFEPASKRGRPRKGEERHKTKSCREELSELKKVVKSIASDLKEFKQITETNFIRLGYEVNAVKPEEKKVELTEAERVILENVDKRFNWIARDYNNDICIYINKPSKSDKVWIWNEGCKDLPCSNLFLFIQFSDNEPYEIAKLLEG